jgi:hypothetical protein
MLKEPTLFGAVANNLFAETWLPLSSFYGCCGALSRAGVNCSAICAIPSNGPAAAESKQRNQILQLRTGQLFPRSRAKFRWREIGT